MDTTPWYDTQLFAAIVAASLPIVVGSITTYRKASQQRKASSELERAQAEIGRLRQTAAKYEEVRKRLGLVTLIHEYEQPVLLLGPRRVGKTSLMEQWHAPWQRVTVKASQTRSESRVPIYDQPETHMIDNWIMPGTKSEARAHLKLLVYDFPGEVSLQKTIIDLAQSETERLSQGYGFNLGVVLVCMVDAVEAAVEFGSDTLKYYNGDLFGRLTEMTSVRSVKVERLIIVFNKFDLLKQKMPTVPDTELLTRCVERFDETFRGVLKVGDSENRCETVAVLNGADPKMVQGATFILGEASRGLVAVVAGRDRAERDFGQAPRSHSILNQRSN